MAIVVFSGLFPPNVPKINPTQESQEHKVDFGEGMERWESTIITHTQTGCQYILYSSSGSMSPLYGKGGNVMGCGEVE